MQKSSHYSGDEFLRLSPLAITVCFMLVPASLARADNSPTPAAREVTAKIDEDTPGVVKMLGTGAAGEKLTYLIVKPPQHGRLSPTQDEHTLFYSPEEDYHGSDEFTYKVSNGRAESAPATARIAQ